MHSLNKSITTPISDLDLCLIFIKPFNYLIYLIHLPCPNMRPRSTLPQPRAFALAISLVLMALMVLLMTSIATLTSFELATASHKDDYTATRENARFALLEAMGQVQQFLGPDARVTARQDIYDADADTPLIEGVANPWLTVIWDAAAPNQLPRHLISGNNQGAFDPSTATNYPEAYLNQNSEPPPDPEDDDDIALIYEDPIHPENNIYAPKADIRGLSRELTGRYAWVVLDEGVKVNLSARAQPESPEALEELANQQLTAPRSVGIELLAGMEDFSEYTMERQLIEQSISNSVLNHLSEEDEDLLAAKSFHHATFNTAGILSKTTQDAETGLWGGLKFDLTNAMSSEALDLQLSGERIFPAATNQPSDDGGPLWDQLHAWVNLSPSNGRTDANAAYATSPHRADMPGITPVLTLVQLHVNVLVLEEPGAPNQYSIWYFLQPAFVLWNPYDAEISDASFVVDSQLSNSSASELKWLHRVEWHPRPASSEPVVKFPTMGVVEEGEQYQYIGLPTPEYGRIAFRLNLESNLKPGEAIIFSPSTPDQVITDASSPLDLYPGYRGGFSFAFKVPNSTMTIDAAEHELAVLQTVSQQRVSGVVRLARNVNELATQPLQHIERLNVSGFNSRNRWDRLYAESSQLNTYGELGSPTGPLIEDIPANFAYRAGLKFAQSRLQIYESSNPSSVEYFRTQWLEDYDPTAVYAGRSPLEYETNSSRNGGTGENPSWMADFFYTSELAASPDDADIPSSDNNAFVGFTDDASGSLSAPLFHLPRSNREFYSIADLRHARLSLAQDYSQALDYWKWGNTSPAYAIGSSNASPYLQPENVYRAQWPDFDSPEAGSPVYYDMPWNLNTALWDDYFFSTVVDDSLRSLDYIAENPRIYAKSDLIQKKLDSAEEAAGELYVHGAFNVNSTSVEAWKALLAANFGAEVKLAHDDIQSYDEQTPFLRHPYPSSAEVDGNSATLPQDHETYTGYRTLDDEEIDALANAIVEQVKLRGPFISMAEFVNRAPVPTSHQGRAIEEPDAWREKGVLQAAIDNSKINEHFFDENDASDNDDDTYEYSVEAPDELYLDEIIASRYFREFNRDAMEGAFAANAPGYLTQGDLLAQLGGFLTVRSDTFRIRVWAESLNPLGSSNGEIWAEAVVQRTPNKLDPNEAIVDGDPVDGQGRKFTVTSFRWLKSPSDH